MNGSALILVISAGFLAAMFVLSAWAARELPSDGPVPIHFDIKGKADGFGSRWVTLTIMPAVYVAVSIFIWLIGLVAEPEPLGERVAAHVVLGVALLATHGFIMFLLLRWARNA